MGQEDYELLPHEEVENLRKEVTKLRNNSLVGTKEDNRLNQNIMDLTDAINKLYTVFDGVRKDILQDFEMRERPEDLLGKLIDQNKTIAHTLLVMSEKIEKLSSSDADKLKDDMDFMQDQHQENRRRTDISQNSTNNPISNNEMRSNKAPQNKIYQDGFNLNNLNDNQIPENYADQTKPNTPGGVNSPPGHNSSELDIPKPPAGLNEDENKRSKLLNMFKK